MSTIIFAQNTTDRLDGQKKNPQSTITDTVAALVPAEALAVHTAIFALATQTIGTPPDPVTVTVTCADALWVAVFGGAVVAFILSMANIKKGNPGPWFFRSLIPVAAYIIWMALLPVSALELVIADFWPISSTLRQSCAIVAGVILGAVASWSAASANTP